MSHSGFDFGVKNIQIDIEEQSPGSICLFGGEYYFRSMKSVILKIPLELCAVRPVNIGKVCPPFCVMTMLTMQE